MVGICSTGLEFGTRKAELVWLIRTGLEGGTREAMFGVAGYKPQTRVWHREGPQGSARQWPPLMGDTRTWGHGHGGMGTRGHGDTRGMGTPRDVTPLPLGGKALHGGMWTSHRHVDRKLRGGLGVAGTPDMAPYRLSYTQATTRPLSPLF